jgi:hypothetical protein
MSSRIGGSGVSIMGADQYAVQVDDGTVCYSMIVSGFVARGLRDQLNAVVKDEGE